MKRIFASVVDFDAWHEAAKLAVHLPDIGDNAATGEPAVDKQQTTNLTSLDRDEEGNVILEATVTNAAFFARGFQDSLIRAGLFTASEIAVLASQYPEWAPVTSYSAGNLRVYSGVLYVCLQAHVSEPNVFPPIAPALWTPAEPSDAVDESVLPGNPPA
jgi:hypothetical protein